MLVEEAEFTTMESVIDMKYSLPLAACLLLLLSCFAQAQGPGEGKMKGKQGKQKQGKQKQGKQERGGPSPSDIGKNPQDIGDAGVAWYTTWETGLAEATRSNRPIFFMSAATSCAGGVSGVF